MSGWQSLSTKKGGWGSGWLNGFSVLNWFAKGEQGAWYDPSDLTTLFQDSAGTTPVTAVEQPVGLMLDKSGRGNRAFQATAGNRPVLSARVNLLTKTEDFSVSPWLLVNSTVNKTAGTAPDGTNTLNKLIPSASGRSADYQTITSLVASVSYDFRVYVKQVELTWVYIRIYDGTDKGVWFNTATGSYGTAESGATTKTPILFNGGYWIGISVPVITSISYQVAVEPCDGNGVKTVSGNGANGIYIWGADLRPTNAGALLPPYQRVNTASDYDTVGFPLYLAANGTSSAMSTNSIDFTATDKMTVVTGVRKLAGTDEIIIEMSAPSAQVNPGAFNYGYAPGSYTILLNGLLNTVTYYQPVVTLGTTNVDSSIFNLSGTTKQLCIIPKINGVLSQSGGGGTTAGGGNFGNYPLYLFARAGTSLFLNGQFYGAIIRGAASDTASVTQTENYMATKTGITF